MAVISYVHLLTVFQVRFALSSSSVFSRTDTVTDSERFYNSILDLFEDVEETEEVNDLLTWWNRYVSVSALSISLSKPHNLQPDLPQLFIRPPPHFQK
jgi:hypothetical protein